MSVNLENLIEDLRSKVNPPGTNLYPAASEDEWLNKLRGAFWQGVLQKIFLPWIENAAAYGGDAAFTENIVTPRDVVEGYDEPNGWSDDDMPREVQQVMVLLAAWDTTLTKMTEFKSLLRTKAGPVEYEAQRSASLLTAVLANLKAELDEAKKAIKKSGATTVVLDAFIERSYSQFEGDSWWVR